MNIYLRRAASSTISEILILVGRLGKRNAIVLNETRKKDEGTTQSRNNFPYPARATSMRPTPPAPTWWQRDLPLHSSNNSSIGDVLTLPAV